MMRQKEIIIVSPIYDNADGRFIVRYKLKFETVKMAKEAMNYMNKNYTFKIVNEKCPWIWTDAVLTVNADDATCLLYPGTAQINQLIIVLQSYMKDKITMVLSFKYPLFRFRSIPGTKLINPWFRSTKLVRVSQLT